MLKKLVILSSIGAISASLNAADVDFTFSGNSTPQVTSGLSIVYSFSETGDFDGAGDAIDTLTWDITFSAFDRTINGSNEVTLTTQVQANTDTTEFNGAGGTTWNNESLVFTVSNVVLTTTAAGTYDATFTGFTSMFLTAGTFYLGVGGDTIGLVSTGNSIDTFSAAQLSPLVITSTASERNRQLSGSFTVAAIPEPSAYALIAGCFGLASVMLRRRRA